MPFWIGSHQAPESVALSLHRNPFVSMMLLSPELLFAAAGPPPQSVVNKRPLWYLLIVMLAATFFLRMLTVDIMGGVLCALLLSLAVIMVRDGMKDLPKFGLVFGLLCSINFLFYVLPAVTAVIAGRSERKIVPVESLTVKNVQKLTYTLIVRTTSFFDADAGLLYNIQSCGMIAMPLCMLIGSFLGASAHYDIHRRTSRLLEGNEHLTSGTNRLEAVPTLVPDTANRMTAEGMIGNRLGGAYGAMIGNEISRGPKAFQGAVHKLGV